MGTLYQKVRFIDEKMSGADLEDTSSTPKAPMGIVCDIQTEFGYAKAKYVRNLATTAATKGYVLGAACTTQLTVYDGAVNSFRSTCTTGFGTVRKTDGIWAGSICICSTCGGAAPQGETVGIINNVSGATYNEFYFDRSLSAALANGDKVQLYHPWGYEILGGTEVSKTGRSRNLLRYQPGVVCAASLAARYWGWVIVEGVHPACYLSNSVLGGAAGAKVVNTRGVFVTGTTNLLGHPIVALNKVLTVNNYPLYIKPDLGTWV